MVLKHNSMLVFILGKRRISTGTLIIPSLNTLGLQINAPFLWFLLGFSDRKGGKEGFPLLVPTHGPCCHPRPDRESEGVYTEASRS